MNKAEFKKAFADNEAPTPGYLFRDLASWTFIDYATQEQLIKALFDKLHPRNSAFVLYKALHLIAVLCETGHEAFQKTLQLSTYTNALKDFTTYRGPLDVKFGDSWNAKVRHEAEAALEAVFRTRVAPAPTAGLQAGPSTITGSTGGDWSGAGASSAHAADASSAGGGWGSHLSAVLPALSSALGGSDAHRAPATDDGSGFDSAASRVAEMPTENRWAQHQRDLRAAGGAGTSGTFNGIGGGSATRGGKSLLQKLASTALSGVNLVTQFEKLKATQQQLFGDQFGEAARIAAGAGRRSATGVDTVGGYQPVGLQVPVAVVHAARVEQAPPVESGWPSTASSPSPQDAPKQQQQPSAFNLFEDPPAPSSKAPDGGDSPLAAVVLPFARFPQTPSRVELSRFVRAAEDAVDAETRRPRGEDKYDGGAALGEALSAHLSCERPWQERLNALACLEAALRNAAPPLRDDLQRFFTAQPQAVQRNCNVVQASLREKAVRVVQVLHVSSPGSTTAPRAAVDAAVDAGGGAFAGMTLRQGGGANRRVGGVAASPQTVATQATPSPPGEGGSLAAGSGSIRVLRSSTALQARAAPASTSALVNNDGLDDILGVPAPPRPAPAHTTLDDLFGDVSLSPPPPPPHGAPATAASFSADDLFGPAPASSVPPPSQQVAGVAPFVTADMHKLVRIQRLMEYLGTHYDPIAMAELEGLIAQRQQQPQQAPLQGVVASAEGAVAHRSFLTGDGGGGGSASAGRPSQNRALAEAQEEMKRQLEL